jgi:WD40 repeat protein
LVATGGRTLTVRRTSDFSPVFEHPNSPGSITWSPEGRRLAFFDLYRVNVWRRDGGRLLRSLLRPYPSKHKGPRKPPIAVKYSPRRLDWIGERRVLVKSGGVFDVYEVSGGQLLRKHDDWHLADLRPYSVEPIVASVALVNDRVRKVLFDFDRNAILASFPKDASVVASPDAAEVFVLDAAGARLYETATGSLISALAGTEDWLDGKANRDREPWVSLAWSADRKHLAGGMDRNTGLSVWDTQSGRRDLHIARAPGVLAWALGGSHLLSYHLATTLIRVRDGATVDLLSFVEDGVPRPFIIAPSGEFDGHPSTFWRVRYRPQGAGVDEPLVHTEKLLASHRRPGLLKEFVRGPSSP